MLNRKTFNEGFKLICACWNRVSSTALENAYYMALKDLSEAEFELAYTSVIFNYTDKSMPKPAELRGYVRLTSEDKAMLAFGKYQSAVRVNYKKVKFADGLIDEAIEYFGGWTECLKIPDTDWKWHKADWIKLYLLFLRHPPAEIQEKPQNAAKGYPEGKVCA